MSERWKRYRRNHQRRLYEAQKGCCYYCGCRMQLATGGIRSGNDFTFDHIIPKAHGGSGSVHDNMVGACFACNNERGHKDARLFMLEKRGQLA